MVVLVVRGKRNCVSILRAMGNICWFHQAVLRSSSMLPRFILAAEWRIDQWGMLRESKSLKLLKATWRKMRVV